MPTQPVLPALDLDDTAFLSGDRDPVHQRLRDDQPVVTVGPPGHETWIVSRYADVQAVLRHPEGRVQPPGLDAPAWLHEGPARQRLRANMAQTDNPVHARLRGVVGPLFTARRSEEQRAAASAEVDTELDAVIARGGSFDAVSDLAVRVPRGVLRLLIGMADDDWGPIIAAQNDFLMIFSPFPLDPAQQARLDEVSVFYLRFFDELLGRAGEPTALVRRLLDAEEQGALSRVEVLSLMHTVLDAGFETTRTSISNAVELFATVPDLFDRVRADPGLVASAVEELFRVRPPVQGNTRLLAADHVAADGTVIPAGNPVLALIGAANGDERVFDDPRTIDPARPNAARHLTFGGGLHHCLGAPLARVQLQETVAALARRFSRIDLDGEPGARHPSLVFPSLTALNVRAVPNRPS